MTGMIIGYCIALPIIALTNDMSHMKKAELLLTIPFITTMLGCFFSCVCIGISSPHKKYRAKKSLNSTDEELTEVTID